MQIFVAWTTLLGAAAALRTNQGTNATMCLKVQDIVRKFYIISAGCRPFEATDWIGDAWGFRDYDEKGHLVAQLVLENGTIVSVEPTPFHDNNPLSDPNFPANEIGIDDPDNKGLKLKAALDTFKPHGSSVLVAGSMGTTWVLRLVASGVWDGPVLLLAPLAKPARYLLNLVNNNLSNHPGVRFLVLQGMRDHLAHPGIRLKQSEFDSKLATIINLDEGHGMKGVKENGVVAAQYLQDAAQMSCEKPEYKEKAVGGMQNLFAAIGGRKRGATALPVAA